jgi:hypothetical protein
MDLMIALGGGAAGAYSMILPRLSVAFVGVAIVDSLGAAALRERHFAGPGGITPWHPERPSWLPRTLWASKSLVPWSCGWVATAETRELPAARHKGASLTDVMFPRDSGRTVVVATYRTPVPFTPQEVVAIEQKLRPTTGAGGPELRIRSIPVTVSSSAGYLFSSEDLSDYDRPR